MNLSEKFAELKKAGRTAFMPYVCCGDGDTLGLLRVLSGHADVIELGMPFSDPIADGPTIQKAAVRALEGGMTVAKYFDVVREARKFTDVPLVAMTYYNIVFHKGLQEFAAEAKRARVQGLIVPDLPFEESGELRDVCVACGLDLISFVSPTTSEERMRKIAEAGKGFVYCVSVAGVTGSREQVQAQTTDLIVRAKSAFAVPVCVGFGVSSAEHVKAIKSAGGDGVIVGSKIIELYEDGGLEAVGRFAGELSDACGRR